MKELSIEEKAKAYDESLKVAIIAHKDEDKHLKATLERIFPELKELDDDKMREMAIKAVYSPEAQSCIKSWGINPDDVISWLEKQGTFSKKDVNDAYLKGVTDTKNEIEKQYEASYQIRKDIATFIFNYRGDIKDRAKWMNYFGIKVSFVEKQGEQKSVDKVEPKFKVGDWVIRGDTIAQILDIQEQYYVGIDINGKDFTSSRFLNEDKIHLWTIQDAKPGDVLVDRFSKNNTIILYQGINFNRSILAYCGWNGYDLSIKTDGLGYGNLDNTNYVPATKEQRKLLFAKLKEVGYEWDADKKELKTVEQKSAWNEEDEAKIVKLKSFITQCKGFNKENRNKAFDLIDSIKFKSTWKPTEAQLVSLEIACDRNDRVGFDLTQLLKDLKKLIKQ